MTGDSLIDVMTNGYKWELGANRTLNWSISYGWNREYWNNPTAMAQGLSDIFKTFSDVSNIKFNYIGYLDSPVTAKYYGSDINIAGDAVNKFFDNSSFWACAFYPIPNSANKGEIYLNLKSEANNLPSYAPGSAGFALGIHEIGHTLGLKHPHDNGGTNRPTFADIGFTGADKDVFTVMSYKDDASWNKILWDPSSPMMLDVLALQYLYGKNTSTNTGNSIFSLTNYSSYSTIWDPSGNDTVSAANAQESWDIALPYVTLSKLVDTRTGLATTLSSIKTAFLQLRYG